MCGRVVCLIPALDRHMEEICSMKHMQRTDAIRNILRQRVSWISIVVIAMLAVVVFLGITYASDGMSLNLTDYYEQQKLWDLEVNSTVLLSDEDLAAIRNIDGIGDVEGGCETQAALHGDGWSEHVTAISLTERISLPVVTAGRLPQTADECMVEAHLAEKTGIQPGDQVTLDGSSILRETKYTVTGTFNNPEHNSFIIPVTPYVILMKDAFSLEKGTWVNARIFLENRPANRFDPEYRERFLEMKAILQSLGKERAPLRTAQLRTAILNRSDSRQALPAEGGPTLNNATAAVPEGRWIVFCPLENSGYSYSETYIQVLSKLSVSFSLIFIAVGALVIYATVGRMVEEQRSLIGTEKAIGLKNTEILNKYLLFGMSSTIMGTLLGIASAYFLLQRILLGSFDEQFVSTLSRPGFRLIPTVIIFFGSLVLFFLASWLACAKLLRIPAVNLMRSSPSQTAASVSSARMSHQRLYPRLIFRNMITDLRRVIVTIVSVAGCCILVTVGFTMKHGVVGVNDRQFGDIIRFDAELSFTGDGAEFGDLLNREGAESVAVNQTERTFSADNLLNLCTLIVETDGPVSGWYHLQDIMTGQDISLPDDGVLIPRRFSESYHLSVGDSFIVYDDAMSPYDVLVAGVFENYYGHLIFCSANAYRTFFGDEPENNRYLIRLNGLSFKELNKKAEILSGFETLLEADRDREHFDSFTTALNFLIVILLVLASLMGYFILLSLADTYILHKTRELAVMRINGFTVRECLFYAALEPAVTSLTGTAVGLWVGNLFGQYVLRIIAEPTVQYVREPYSQTFLFASAITMVLAAVLNGLALRKLKHLKLTDVNN